MSPRILCLVVMLLGRSLVADPSPTPTPTPVPTMPDTITLSNGAVLHDVSVIRWNSDSVVLKHAGGADTIRFIYIAEPDRTAVLAVRDEAKKNAKPVIRADAQSVAVVKGQVFVASQGGVSYKLGDVTVYLLRSSELGLLETSSASVRLSKPVASAVTDAEGNFTITAPDEGDYFVYAKASRRVGEQFEQYEWRQPLAGLDRQHVQLSVTNLIPFADHKEAVFDE
jgi:hypothetical protein